MKAASQVEGQCGTGDLGSRFIDQLKRNQRGIKVTGVELFDCASKRR